MTRSDPQINIRLPQELKDRIAKAAAERRRSVNAEIVSLLEDHYPEPISIEETAADIARSIKFIRGMRGEATFRILAEQVDELLRQVIDEGLLSPESQEEARKIIQANVEKRFMRGPPGPPDDF